MNRDVKTSVASGAGALRWLAVPAAMLMLMALPACGQKGPLTLPPADSAASAPKR